LGYPAACSRFINVKISRNPREKDEIVVIFHSSLTDKRFFLYTLDK
jgi:hypothetical protein